MSLDTPVAFIIFNRPELTQKVFAAIAAAKPKKLLVVADGPRFPEEAEQCHEARAIIEKVDWDCEVLTNFSDTNMGCKLRVSSGLDWVFSQVEDAIILEDDCLPHPTFFPYCQELLERYRNDESVVVISGASLETGPQEITDSYLFSRYIYIWGWASWRRAWTHYDIEMKDWRNLRETSWLSELVNDKDAARYWKNIFDRVSSGEIDTWDYQWIFACWLAKGLSSHPCVNLISNIGFGEGATHTTVINDVANLPFREMPFPLRHPATVVQDVKADACISRRFYSSEPDRPSLYKRLRAKINSIGLKTFKY